MGILQRITCITVSVIDDGMDQGGSDGSGRHSAAPMLTAIMSGGVGISGRELSLSC